MESLEIINATETENGSVFLERILMAFRDLGHVSGGVVERLPQIHWSQPG